MAFSGNYMCTSFKVELMKAVHNFTTGTGNTFKLALYDNTPSFTAATTAYTASGEVANSGTYSAGGGHPSDVDVSVGGDRNLAKLHGPLDPSDQDIGVGCNNDGADLTRRLHARRQHVGVASDGNRSNSSRGRNAGDQDVRIGGDRNLAQKR
jgi:hypothetical protein